MMNPSDIPELKEIRKIDTIEDAVRLAGFVFSTVCHAQETSPLDVQEGIVENYKLFKAKKMYGWCHTNGLYYHLLLNHYGRESYVYNYGLKKHQFTHVVVVLTIKDDKFLIDPYFNRYYVNKDNEPLTLSNLFDLIKKDPEEIQSVYGEQHKEVYQEGEKGFVKFTPQRLEHSVINSWKVLSNFDNIMRDNFNSINPLLLIPQRLGKIKILNKIENKPYFEFF